MEQGGVLTSINNAWMLTNSLLWLLQLFIMGMAISKYNPLTNSCLTINKLMTDTILAI